jgi:hypothetical protein
VGILDFGLNVFFSGVEDIHKVRISWAVVIRHGSDPKIIFRCCGHGTWCVLQFLDSRGGDSVGAVKDMHLSG